ncbi:nucleoside triphosphate pyrophosphohydrolase [[Phormidium] sp. ETS-05]|uniref:nucleoside triphosphate pyrophosphohydrolase n=1 Tax=[Phormidium] sp. ETS-05 TaxID=222819 RepID=UPI0018EF2EEE|nr:nucleoside triphosphate pyrophosphohydrolase [[Phormidium] sp. ETS-05]
MTNEALTAIERLMAVVAQLRSPVGGCPWDLEQTPETLIPYIIEEAYEVVDAIREGNREAIAEELGDLLLQVVLQAQIASETGQFSMTEIANGITDKMIRRHPHVFGDVQVSTVEEVRQNWEEIKAAEKLGKADLSDMEMGNGGTLPSPTPLSKGGRGDGEGSGVRAFRDSSPLLSSKLKRYNRTLPPLKAALKISEKAAAAGFEWDDIEGIWQKLQEEITEFQEAVQHQGPAERQAELGDMLFMLVQLARWYDIDPDAALGDTNRKFIKRLAKIEAYADRPLTDYTLAELDEFWVKAKAELAKQK